LALRIQCAEKLRWYAEEASPNHRDDLLVFADLLEAGTRVEPEAIAATVGAVLKHGAGTVLERREFLSRASFSALDEANLAYEQGSPWEVADAMRWKEPARDKTAVEPRRLTDPRARLIPQAAWLARV
jgi:hypothetical protein